jgi:hypothetical protein
LQMRILFEKYKVSAKVYLVFFFSFLAEIGTFMSLIFESKFDRIIDE